MTTGKRPLSWRLAEEAAQASPADPRYNVAPTQDVPTVRLVRQADGDLYPEMARWGLIPKWWKKPIKEWKATTINARVETVHEAPSFRDAYRNGRCIMPMSGYYEWSTLTGKKQAYYIHASGNEPGLLVLGLFTEVTLPDFKGATCALLTEEATGEVAAIHDRQPIIVDAAGARMWLDGVAVADIPRLPRDRLRMVKVSNRVNSWKAQGEDLIRPHPSDED